MHLETKIKIADNFPNKIITIVALDKEVSKWYGSIYIKKDEEEVNELVVYTKPIYDSEEEAKKRMGELCEYCVNYVNEFEVKGEINL